MGDNMFEVGDYIIYGSNGVCEVKSVGPIDCPGVSCDKLYYTLRPLYIRDSSVYTPVDNDKVIMRGIMSKAEAEAFVDGINDIDALTINDERKIELEYKKTVNTCDPVELVRMIKTISGRMSRRQSEGKKMTAADMKYIHIAEESLCGELAISLDMDKSEVKNYIATKVDDMVHIA
ncbi:MAG TPA: CarD family transcriptional regulator [Lachnospiraceae bacterium]|nr:CarD family transcriptional regulator [Lachnospiraceae bacterium]